MVRLATGERVITYGASSDVGCVRKENQDFCGKFPENNWDLSGGTVQLIVIADGMGGLEDGARASRHAVERIGNIVSTSDEDVTGEVIRSAFQLVNAEIYGFHPEANGDRRTGTTCTALLLKESSALIAHVGDSRLYRINSKGMVQLTQDHSNVAEMQRRGIITEAEADSHPERSKLYRALGPGPEVEVDIIEKLTLTADEYFILCTDGLHNKVADEEMRENVVNTPPEDACLQLIQLAKERGGEDNITVQVVHLKRHSTFIERVFKRPVR